MPFTTPAAGPQRAVGIGALDVHRSVAGSYDWTVANGLGPEKPPATYTIPFTTPAAARGCPAGIDALVIHVSVPGS